MTWVIVSLVLLFVLGSWLMIRPSPRDRALAKLRNRAIARGMHVDVAPKAGKSNRGETPNTLSRGVVSYWTGWPRGAAPHRTLEAGSVDDLATWSPGVAKSARELLTAMPVEVLLLRASPERLELIWAEEGDVDGLDRALSLIEQIRAEFAGS